MENNLQNGCYVSFKTVLQSQSLEFVTIMIVTNVVIGGFIGEEEEERT